MPTLKLSEYSSMTDDQKLAAIESFKRGRSEKNEKSLSNRIAVFESKFGFNSDLLNEKFSSGEVEDSHDVCTWMMLLRMQKSVQTQSS